ncbi:MAG TPA: hypothetical protein VH251_06560 [Verrucomicrobiae bacterium]|nr:hypothetical protein [Verrucomicrobiae bacterium]
MFQKNLAETPAQRARDYRLLALTAESMAAETLLPSLRDAYLRSADRWHLLAALLEKGMGYTPKKIPPRTSPRNRKAQNTGGPAGASEQTALTPARGL